MEKCVPANFTRSRQGRLLAVVPVQRGGERAKRKRTRRGGGGRRGTAVQEKRGKRGRKKGEDGRAEEEADEEKERARAGRRLLQPRERRARTHTHASDGGNKGSVARAEGYTGVVDLNALQKKVNL